MFMSKIKSHQLTRNEMNFRETVRTQAPAVAQTGFCREKEAPFYSAQRQTGSRSALPCRRDTLWRLAPEWPGSRSRGWQRGIPVTTRHGVTPLLPDFSTQFL